MKRKPAFIILLCSVLSACSAPSERMHYVAFNSEQMKNSSLVGRLVEYCLVGEQRCDSYSHKFMWVAKQDETSISANNGESVSYSDIQRLIYPATATEDIKNSAAKGLLLPAMVLCSALSNSCWH